MANISSKLTERRLKWSGHVIRKCVHADIKPPRTRRRPRTKRMDVSRDVKMVGLERKMADDRKL